MSFFSFHFILFLALLVFAYSWRDSQRYRQWVLSAANVLFLLTFLTTVESAIALVVFLLLSYAVLLAIAGRVWRYTVGMGIALAIALLLVVKRYAMVKFMLPESVLRTSVEFIGLSYMVFKWIHMAVDLHQEQLARVTLPGYVNYQLGFFSLAAGPIQRYNAFQQFWAHGPDPPKDAKDGLLALNRILNGMIKIGCWGALALLLHDEARQNLAAAGSTGQVVTWFLVIFYAYPIYVYFNFSGYCDAVIGAARLLGMKQQENFDRPYVARDMIEFWNRWHISLTTWIRDYVFMTSYKWVAWHWPARAQAAGYFLLFMALCLAGMWHGPGRNFIVFGIIQGAGVAGSRIYGEVLKKGLGREGLSRYLANRWIRALAITVNLNYICFSFLFFVAGGRETLGIVYAAVRKLF